MLRALFSAGFSMCCESHGLRGGTCCLCAYASGQFCTHLCDKEIPEYMAKEARPEVLFVDNCLHAWATA